MIYVILGMHKSGTTLIAQTLHRSGISMGDDLSAADLDYGAEKAESRSARLINSQILQSEGKYSLELEALAKPFLSEQTECLLREFVELHQKKYETWGFKDPRTVLTYEIWREHLPQRKLIVVYRPVDQVWRHYTRGRLSGSKAFSAKTFRKGFRALDAWYVYNRKLLDIYQQERSNSILINYDHLMEEPAILSELNSFTETTLEDCRLIKAKGLTLIERVFCGLHRLLYRLKRPDRSLGQLYRELESSVSGNSESPSV